MRRRGILNEFHLSKKKNEGYVYIGHIPKVVGVYKIGRTYNLASRLSRLKAEYGESFAFVYISDLLYNNVEVEEFIHSTLLLENTKKYFSGEEWFEIGLTHLDCVINDIKIAEKISFKLFEQERWENGYDDE